MSSRTRSVWAEAARVAAVVAEAALFAAGLIVLAGVYVTAMEAQYTEMVVRASVASGAGAPRSPRDPRGANPPGSRGEPERLAPRALPSDSVPLLAEGIVGELVVPRLAASAPLLEGTASRTLRLGVGHLSQTPLPWERGNSAFAGHRDTFFRTLRLLHVGDAIEVVTPEGTFDYRVEHLRVVDPEDVWILHPGLASLTLITCYPFTYVGSAPQRFVVQAERVEATAAADR